MLSIMNEVDPLIFRCVHSYSIICMECFRVSSNWGENGREREALLGILPICSSSLLPPYIGFFFFQYFHFSFLSFQPNIYKGKVNLFYSPTFPFSNQINPKGHFMNLKSKMLCPSMKLI